MQNKEYVSLKQSETLNVYQAVKQIPEASHLCH